MLFDWKGLNVRFRMCSGGCINAADNRFRFRKSLSRSGGPLEAYKRVMPAVEALLSLGIVGTAACICCYDFRSCCSRREYCCYEVRRVCVEGAAGSQYEDNEYL